MQSQQEIGFASGKHEAAITDNLGIDFKPHFHLFAKLYPNLLAGGCLGLAVPGFAKYKIFGRTN